MGEENRTEKEKHALEAFAAKTTLWP